MDRELSVTYMSGPLDGKTVRFEQPEIGDELVLNIGRREGCDLHLPFDNQVSRLHARLGCLSTAVTASESVTEPFVLSFWLEDMRSRNGTYLKVRGKVPVPPGSTLIIGSQLFQVTQE